MDCVIQMNVRVPEELEADIRADAKRNFGNNASEVLRFYTRLGLAMRHQLGPQFEPFVVGYLGREALDRIKAAP